MPEVFEELLSPRNDGASILSTLLSAPDIPSIGVTISHYHFFLSGRSKSTPGLFQIKLAHQGSAFLSDHLHLTPFNSEGFPIPVISTMSYVLGEMEITYPRRSWSGYCPQWRPLSFGAARQRLSAYFNT